MQPNSFSFSCLTDNPPPIVPPNTVFIFVPLAQVFFFFFCTLWNDHNPPIYLCKSSNPLRLRTNPTSSIRPASIDLFLREFCYIIMWVNIRWFLPLLFLVYQLSVCSWWLWSAYEWLGSSFMSDDHDTLSQTAKY